MEQGLRDWWGGASQTPVVALIAVHVLCGEDVQTVR